MRLRRIGISPKGLARHIEARDQCRIGRQFGAPFVIPENGSKEQGDVKRALGNAGGRYGKIANYAGTGTVAAGGDGGWAIAANLNLAGIALDPQNNLLIADGANYRVRLVTASNGIITTIGGNGLITYNPKNMSRNGDVLYFSDSNANRVSKFDLSAGASSISLVSGTGAASFSASDDIALTARLNTPKGLTVDSAGNIYPADSKNHRVRKITPPTCLWM